MAKTPAERALLQRLMTLVRSRAGPRARPTATTLAVLLVQADALLVEVPNPTRLRGMVQLFRSDLLGFGSRDEEAAAAAQEAIKLLPGYSAPHYAAAQVETYRDRPLEALDHYVAAAAIDPGSLAQLSEDDVDALVRRLDQQREDERLVQFAEILARADWEGAPDTQSTLALARLKARVKAGDIAAAERLLVKVVRPGAFSVILTDRRLAALRPAAIREAGPRLEKLWPRYLAVAQAQWQANAHGRVRRLYADVLVAAGHDRSLIATFAPMFEGRIDPADDSFLFAAVPVARAYARLGQWQRGYDLLDKVAGAFAGQDLANSLNVTAARAMLLREEGRIEEALAAFDLLIAESRRHAGSVGGHNLATMHGYRACLLEDLGRGAEATASWQAVRERKPPAFASLVDALLCRGDLAGARQVLIAALDGESTRAAALDLVQPPERPPYPSEYSRRQAERWARLRADPQLRAAALRYGDLLPGPLNASAPPDPLPAGQTPSR